MTGAEGSRASAIMRIAAACTVLMVLAGCSGGLPSMASLTTFGDDTPAKQASDANKAPVNVADLVQPGLLGDVSIGKANAPVTVIQYVSLTCTDCSRFQGEAFPKLKKAYIDKGKVRFIVREYPVDSSASAAAVVARCLPEKDYFRVTDKLLLNQKDWAGQEVRKDAIYNVVKFTGLKRDKFDACFTNQRINDALVMVKQRGVGFGVTAAPTFFVNGKKVAGAVSYEEMQSVIEGALSNSQPAGQPQAQTPQPKPQQQASAAKST